MALALALGAATGPLAGALPALLPGAFTSDPALWPLMRQVSFQVCCVFQGQALTA